MFDPFKDFETAGYLRNVRQDKNPQTIKRFEHDLFESNFQGASEFLATLKTIGYHDFLTVHKLLFSDYYPWAGQDRQTTAPDIAVRKGDENGGVLFEHPARARLAIEYGLELAQKQMAQRPGEVMGLFAFGHPFLDGNGRTMLLVHMELCHRAGFSIEWEKTNKTAYLAALTNEIKSPGIGVLDSYLLGFKGPRIERDAWQAAVRGMKGLDGLQGSNQVDGDLSDPAVAERYRQLSEGRGYTYAAVESLSSHWKATPAKSQHSGRIVALSEMEVIQEVGRGDHVVWDRRKLQARDITVGQHARIKDDGSVTLMTTGQRPSKGVGR